MKKQLIIYGILMTCPIAMGSHAKLTGPTTCARSQTYNYVVNVVRDDDDKHKGNLKRTKYEWFLLGKAFEKVDASSDSDTATVKTIFVDKFSQDPKYWPQGSAQVTVKLLWSRLGQEQRTSNQITCVISPQHNGQIQ